MAPWPEAPEFKVTTLSYVMSLMPDTILRDLQLERHGYRVHPTGPYFLPFPDGRCIVQYDDSAKNYDEFAKFSKHDADAIERMGRVDRGSGRGARPAPHDHAADRRIEAARRPLRSAPAGVAVPRAGREDGRRRHAPDDDVHRRHPRSVLRVGPGEDRDVAERPDRHVGRAVRAGHRLRDGAPLDRRRRRRPPRRVGRAGRRDGRGRRPRSRPARGAFGAEVRTNARVARILTSRRGRARGVALDERRGAARAARRHRRSTRRSRSCSSSTRPSCRRLRATTSSTGARGAAS